MTTYHTDENRFMKPDELHMVLTISLVDDNLVADTPGTICHGVHFHNYMTLHHTLMGKIRDALSNNFITNNDHADSESSLHRMGFAVYQWWNSSGRTAPKEGWNSSFGGYLQISCLLWMLLCPEFFNWKPKRGTLAANLPDTLIRQRYNARIMSFELISDFREQKGAQWTCWLQIKREMDDRVLNRDDVPSPIRRLISDAQTLAPIYNNIPPSIYDARFQKLRHEFYDPSTATHACIKHEDYADYPELGPDELPAWSNVAEGSCWIDEGTGVATFSSRRDVMLLDRRQVLSPRQHPNSKKQRKGKFTAVDESIKWMEDALVLVKAEGERMSKSDKQNWWTKAEGGKADSIECWIGRLVKDSTPAIENDVAMMEGAGSDTLGSDVNMDIDET